MLTAQRKKLIGDELAKSGRVVATELAQRFGLSADTIRRDLRQLAAAGECRRVYGGAVAPTAGSLIQRHNHLSEEKCRLANDAVKLLKPGQTIMIDAGSTNSAIARALPADMNLSVVTNALDIASLLAVRRDIRLTVLGGNFHPEFGACLGPETRASIASNPADWLFLGSCGLDAIAGVTAFDSGEAEAKKVMVETSDRIVAVTTREKMGTVAPFQVVPTRRLHMLIAEHSDALNRFKKSGVTVVSPRPTPKGSGQ